MASYNQLGEKFGRVATKLASIGNAKASESVRKADELDERLTFVEQELDAHTDRQLKEFNSLRENVADTL